MKKYSRLTAQHFQGVTVANLLAYHDKKSLYMLVYPDNNFVKYAVYNQGATSSEEVPESKSVFQSLNLLDALVEYNQLP